MTDVDTDAGETVGHDFGILPTARRHISFTSRRTSARPIDSRPAETEHVVPLQQPPHGELQVGNMVYLKHRRQLWKGRGGNVPPIHNMGHVHITLNPNSKFQSYHILYCNHHSDYGCILTIF